MGNELRTSANGVAAVRCQQNLPPSELRAVQRHQGRLADQWGRTVSFDTALDHWLQHVAEQWRQRRQMHCLELQRLEIQKHKWIESEKARCDLGTRAVFDWIEHYAADFRTWYEHEVDDEAFM